MTTPVAAPSLDGIVFRIPLHEGTIGEAAELVDNDAFYHQTRIAILFHFNVTVDDYWSLTVGDHLEMVAYLDQKGLL